MTNRGLIAGAAVAGVLALAAWRMWPRGAARRDGAAPAAAEMADGPRVTPVTDAAAGPPTAVHRLTVEERRTLGAQIAAARDRARQRAAAQTRAVARADAGVASDAGALDPADVVIPVERVSGPLRDALEESISLLADCYEQQPGGAPGREAMVRMRMTSDPDFGTVIDTDEITGGDGAALTPALDDCLRDTIDSLALPPLGEGGKLEIQYSFRFDPPP